MSWLAKWRNTLWRRGRYWQELAEEQELHLELAARDLEARGMPPAQARLEARRRFGSPLLVADRTADADRLRLLETLFQESRLALRGLSRRRGLMATAVASLALGIGATSAIFGVVDAVLLRPLALPEADRLVVIEESKNGEVASGNPARTRDWGAQVEGLAAVTAFYREGLVLGGEGGPQLVIVARSVGQPLAVSGLRPLLGRGFTAEEENGAGPTVALLAEKTWRSRFGAEPSVVGRVLRLSGQAVAVIGVVPSPAGYPPPFELLMPAPADVQAAPRRAGFLRAVGRMKPGVDRAQLDAQLATVARRLAEEYPDTDAGRSARTRDLVADLGESSRRPLLVLLATVALVLLMVCVNVASLLLARAAERGREGAIRLALGSGRAGLARLYLVESCMLAALGGGLGLVVAATLLEVLQAVLPASTPRLGDAALDARVLAFGLAVALVAGFVCGLAPAWQATRRDPARGLGQRGRAGGTPSGLALRRALVGLQVALSMALLTTVGLLAKSLIRQLDTPPGFESRSVLAVAVNLPWDTPRERLDAFRRQALAAFESLPGVRAAGVVDRLPLEGGSQSGPIAVAGRELGPEWAERPVGRRAATPGYFRALGVPLLAGRLYLPTPPAGAVHETVINQALAARLFPAESPLGRRLSFNPHPEPGRAPTWFEVVGVVGNVRQALDETEPPLEAFILPEHTYWPMLSFVLATPGDPAASIPAVRAALERVDPEQVVDAVGPLEARLRTASAEPRTRLGLVGSFALVALLLAALGLYGVLASLVVERTREIGVRLALGAKPAEVLRAVVRQGTTVSLAGLALGLGVATLGGRLLGSLLFDVRPLDPPVLQGASLLMLAVAVLASLLPARRAARVDPALTLRQE
ncbi:MAG: ADOP family duplicated permease [Thermoanaerobaculia bacterium]